MFFQWEMCEAECTARGKQKWIALPFHLSMAIEAACCRSLLLRGEAIEAGENSQKAIAAYEKSKVTTMAFNKHTGKRVEI